MFIMFTSANPLERRSRSLFPWNAETPRRVSRCFRGRRGPRCFPVRETPRGEAAIATPVPVVCTLRVLGRTGSRAWPRSARGQPEGLSWGLPCAIRTAKPGHRPLWPRLLRPLPAAAQPLGPRGV